MFTLISGVTMREQAPEGLLLFWGQHLTDILHQRDMRQPKIHLLGGNSLEGGLHPAQIHGVSTEQLPEGHAHRVDLGLEPNDLFGLGALQRLHRALLALTESKLLQTPLEMGVETGEAVGPMLRESGPRRRRQTRPSRASAVGRGEKRFIAFFLPVDGLHQSDRLSESHGASRTHMRVLRVCTGKAR